MREGICIFLTLIHLVCYAVDPDILFLRVLLSQSNSNQNSANLLYNQTSTLSGNSEPLKIGFKGMGELMLCNHTNNVFSKYSHFNEGKKLLEIALGKEPENAELIYFRFITQTNAPSFLGYNANIASDKVSLISYLEKYDKIKNADPGLVNLIKNYLLQSKSCTKEEKEKIKKL